MAQSNYERVGRALSLLKQGLQPFVERQMQATYGSRWQYEAVQALRDQHIGDDGLHLDSQALLLIIWDQWQPVFRNVLGHAERSLVSELRETRNEWAHQRPFSTDDAYRALDSIQRLLNAVSAAQEAGEVERQKQELLRQRFEEQARNETRKVSATSVEGRPGMGLRPWREVITPHPDVASGRYESAEFAADLGQVARGLGAQEYRDPRAFYQRTYLTYGLRRLLIDALQRLDGSGGNPVVDLQTNFGGGKTHSLLALYHLFSGVPASELAGLDAVLREAGVAKPPEAQRAVLVGYELSPGIPRPKPDGCIVNTLWGELAWQLLGKDGFAMVAEADRQGVSPGSDVLRELFAAAAPCLILIDEWVVYARQLYNISGLPGGSFDANLSFAQSLTEAAKAAPRTLLVATIPASDAETGGEGGREAAERLKRIFGSVESPWRPADAEEGFEIVRRRLFQNIADPASFVARDAVARAFVEFYRGQPQEFPAVCGEADYERRIRHAYPIHPELFDRLYTDWSSIEGFQRTRGVLRLMAAVVHALWEGQDNSILIMPATVPVAAPKVQYELTRYLENSWVPVIESEVDGTNALPARLDRENPNLGRYSACRRVARTIYLGSAPTLRSQNRGLPVRQINLGCTQPGESVAIFGDALRRLADSSAYLTVEGQRYWYSTQPTVARLAQDRAAQYSDEEVLDKIEERVRAEQANRGDFARVHPCPASSSDVADDDMAARLVILKPRFSHALHDAQSSGMAQARDILNTRGDALRHYRNTLVFLAADRARLEDLKQGMRQFLAWESILRDSESLNLDASQRNQASTRLKSAEETVKARIPETYIWLLVPEQLDTHQPESIEEYRLQPQPQSPLASNASRKLRTEDLLLTQYAGTLLRGKMDEIPLWRGDHVTVKELAEFFARYLYLPRLKNTEVLLAAIREGVQSLTWEQETFAYADSYDAERQRYLGLKAGQQVQVALNSNAVVVKPEAAARQFVADAQVTQQAATALTYTAPGASSAKSPAVSERGGSTLLEPARPTATPSSTEQTTLPAERTPQAQRFHGSIKLNPRMMAGNAGTIMDEVVRHLTAIYGADVQVTLEIQATIPAVPDDIKRTIEENCRTLRFESFDFEEE